jgi:hypothetical protein
MRRMLGQAPRPHPPNRATTTTNHGVASTDAGLSPQQMTDEIWRDVVGYEGHYEVSNRGRVRSLKRTVPVRSPQQERWVRAKILRPTVRPCDGREKLTLAKHGTKQTCTVAQLMQQAGFPVKRRRK